MRIAIIGGGLAGTACAYVFRRQGWEPVIYEAADTLASGASGNEVGLYNPRFTADAGAVQAFYSSAFFEALKVFETLGDHIDWTPCGALHLVNDEKKARRFPKTVESWNWGADDMRMVSAQEASEIAGVRIDREALYLPRSGTVCPRKLCEVYAQDVEVHLNTAVENLSDIKADAVVLACGMGVLRFEETKDLPLRAVRGQVSYIGQSENSSRLSCTIGYGGYVAPSKGGVHCLGSTFQRWLDHSEILEEDDQDNIGKLCSNVPSLAGAYEVMGHRAAVRTTSQDHFPVVGQVDDRIYVSTAHGSHGILSSLRSARVLSGLIQGHEDIDSEGDLLRALSPSRF